ncbi:MAG: hypothetical protein PUE57_07320 [Lactimicrobium massiliense]|nr:hypothetical protein [Lactimicrobium massiliense]
MQQKLTKRLVYIPLLFQQFSSSLVGSPGAQDVTVNALIGWTITAMFKKIP